ncbi:MAG: hypothetical protein BMS9Abin12_2140 [Acidimicrobiia bacterium]|nr:MAG: hypothetical protein BMS9Abin12_2140 [Acidimicrobiia bacterium]
MGSLGAGELVVIAIVAIVVFGPRRLPEIARKASELLKQAREATRSFTDALDSEYDGITAPLRDLKTEYDETIKSIKEAVPAMPDLSVTLPDGKPDKAKSEESVADSQVPIEGNESTGEMEKPVGTERSTDIEEEPEALPEQPDTGEAPVEETPATEGETP